MRRLVPFSFVIVLVMLSATSPSAESRGHVASWLDAYREPAARLIGEALSSSFAWNRLALMGDTFGNRLGATDTVAAYQEAGSVSVQVYLNYQKGAPDISLMTTAALRNDR